MFKYKEYTNKDCFEKDNRNEVWHTCKMENFISLSEERHDYYKTIIRLLHHNQVSSIEKKFNNLAEKWKNETGLFSTSIQKVNDTLLDIIGMGSDIVPFILKDLTKPSGTAHWHIVLKAITKENPVSDLDNQKNSLIKKAWIEWGKINKPI